MSLGAGGFGDQRSLGQVWFTPEEAADYLRVSVRTISRLRNTNNLMAYPLATGSRSVRYRREELDALLDYPTLRRS